MTLPPLSDRYNNFIQDLLNQTLKGEIRSKEQVYGYLCDQLQPGTGEVFERCLGEQISQVEAATQSRDERQQSKALRQQRALKTLTEVWLEWLKKNQAATTISAARDLIVTAPPEECLSKLIHILDPNQSQTLNHSQIEQLALELENSATSLAAETEAYTLRQMALGLKRGVQTFSQLEGSLMSWIYESPSRLGIGVETVKGPWASWAKSVNSSLVRNLCLNQANNQSAAQLVSGLERIDLASWLELVIVLRGLKNGLIAWFDQQPYNFAAGKNLAGVTFMVFALIWSELSQGFSQATYLSPDERQRFAQASFQISLQILRSFARRDNFPLYGGVFANFSGEGFRDSVAYLDQPLKATDKVQEKARIFTVLGYSQRWLGNYHRARELHQEAINLARQAADQPCEVANLNHLSRLSLEQKDFAEAINLAQRALILARQAGDREGEGNALVSLGYSEVMQIRLREVIKAEDLELPLSYLEQGQKLAQKFPDLVNQALCCLGLGAAYLALQQPSQAQHYLEQGLPLFLQLGDRILQGMAYLYLAETAYQLQQPQQAIFAACLSMYLLEQRQQKSWHQAASLLMLLQGRLGEESFEKTLQACRSQLIPLIGVDGFDYLLGKILG
jgi:tetratricopeptide (TPR) repeat protein